MTSAALAGFDAYTGRLADWARSDDRVLGLLLLGSGADRDRIDSWSDHDVAVIAMPAAVEELRADLSWLPDASRIVAVGREWHDGFKALYDDGRVVEFAVTDARGFETFPVAGAAIVYDEGPAAAALAMARRATRPRPQTAPAAAAVVLLVELVVGVGRVRRGEVLSGADVIRSEAARTLADLVVARSGRDHPDPFDGLRRFEAVAPRLAKRMAETLTAEPEQAARGLLDLAEEALAPGWADWPAAGARAVRSRLGWEVRDGGTRR